jgi:MerR family transcriptional regulator, light-induced transcriptional regulator
MPIGELSRRVGVSPDLLRKWERRYAVLRPGRTVGNQRLYSRVDEARLRLMLRHVRNGVAAAQAAELATAARFRITPSAAAVAAVDQAEESRAQMRTALDRYDETGAEQALEKLFATRTATAVIRDVFLPFLRELGERWVSAHASVAQEHFASAFIQSRLLGLARGWDRGLGPRAVLACPPDEHHTFGLIAFGIALHQNGWRITYLGADTPVGMIEEAARSVRPRLIAVSAARPGPLQGAMQDLSRLAADWRLVVAGAGSNRELVSRFGALHLTDDPITAAQAVLA